MAWENLISAVEAVITANGNNEITGTILKDLFVNNIIPQLGSNLYKGIANTDTNPGTPEKEEFYLASVNGLYPNFAGLSVLNEIALFVYKNGEWEKESVKDLTYKSDLEIGKNKFNKNRAVSGYYKSSSGTNVVSATSAYSDFIPVITGQEFISTGTTRFTCFYDENKNVVAGGGGSTTAFTIPAGVHFVVVTCYLTSLNTYQLELGTVATDYEDYKLNVKKEQLTEVVSKGTHSINVVDFGAIGDDSTDNTQAFIKAKEKALSTGIKKIFVPNGVYLTQQLDFLTTDNSLNNFVFEGVGWQAEIKLKQLALSGKNSVLNFIGTGVNIEGLNIRNLCINGNESVHTGTRTVDMEGINLQRGVRGKVQNVLFKNCISEGVDIDNGVDFTVENCYAINCGGHGIHNSLSSRRTRVINNIVENCGVTFSRAGIDQFQSSSDGIYIGNTCINNYRNYDISGEGATFEGNKSIKGVNTVVKDNFVGVGRTLASINPLGAGSIFSLIASNEVEFDIIDVSAPAWEKTLTGGANVSQGYRNMHLYTGAVAGTAKMRIAGGHGLTVGYTYNNHDLSRAHYIQLALTNSGARNGVSRFSFCKASADGVGDLVRKGFGFKLVGNALFGTLHDGTIYYEVDLATVVESAPVQCNIFSNGVGNVYFIVNGEIKGTSANAPTGGTGSNNNSIQFEVENSDGTKEMDLRVHSFKIAVAISQ